MKTTKYLKQKLKFIKNIGFLFKIYNWIFYRKFIEQEKLMFQNLLEMKQLSSKDIFDTQEEKLLSILEYAYNNTKYYKELFDKHNIDITKTTSLKNIPILTKKIIRNNIDNLLSKRFSKESLAKRNTGGSTGEPLEFYSDHLSGYFDNAHHWYLYSLMGYKKGDIIIGSGGTSIPQKLRDKNIYWIKESKDCVWGEYDFSVLYITDSNIRYYVEKLLEIKPAILRGYPSFFDKLATYIMKKNIKIDFFIKGIILTAEMCSTSQRLNIEKAFSSMVYFEYGHSEICLFCYTQDNSYIYKSSPLYGYIEVLDDDGNEVDVGDVGNIVVTGFNNHGMPFIRYDTGDMGEVYSKNGGTISFKKILGRNQDYILSKDNQKVFLTALIFGQHLKAFQNVVQWQLQQDKIGVVTINIIKGVDFNKTDETEILNNFNRVADLDLIFNYVTDIPITKRGKHLFLIQKIRENCEY
jgi:phenylacetate-CoA ligase